MVLLFGYVPSTDKRTASPLRSGCAWPGLTGFVSLSLLVSSLLSSVCSLSQPTGVGSA